MRRPLALAVVLPALLAAPAALRAQQPAAAQPASSASAPPALAAGWTMRLDRPGAPTAALKFVTMGSGLHATTGPSAIFWNPATSATGAYTVEASFTQTRAPAHPEAYGLLVGGRDLAGERPEYLYFVVRGDGKFLVRHRAGTELHTLQEWTAHPAVKAADAAGKATNALRIRTTGDSLLLDVNGQQVGGFARPAGLNLDGLVGLRVNHQLDVHIDGPRVTPAAATR
jgi:hypothetical protein